MERIGLNLYLFRRLPICFLISLLAMVSACTGQTAETPTQFVTQQLRIANNGNADIADLVILFPGATSVAEALQVPFGDVAAGKTTEYHDVPGGVYRYAAYGYKQDGRNVTQPVTDWVGERPMTGSKFTYRIAFDPQKPTGGQIQLIEALTDEP